MAMMAPPKPKAMMEIDRSRRARINNAATEPKSAGRNAKSPKRGLGKAKISSKAIPKLARSMALSVSCRAMISLSRAAR